MARHNFRIILETLPYVFLAALYLILVLPPFPLILSPNLGSSAQNSKPRRSSFWSRPDPAFNTPPPLRLPRYSFEREIRLGLAVILGVFCIHRMRRRWPRIALDFEVIGLIVGGMLLCYGYLSFS